MVLPWDTTVARIFCTAYEPPHLPEVGGRPLAIDTRALLIRSHEAFTARTGFEVRSGTEPEMTWEGPGVEVVKAARRQPRLPGREPRADAPDLQEADDLRQGHGPGHDRGRLRGPGQLELNWSSTGCTDTADRLITYRQICNQVAREFGVIASFMPKPCTGSMGNGCHHNVSLWNGDEPTSSRSRVGANCTSRARSAGTPSAACSPTPPGSIAVMASTVNSYKRFWDGGQFAPTTVNWGMDNKTLPGPLSADRPAWSTRCRTPASTRICPTPLLLAAMEDGIDNAS